MRKLLFIFNAALLFLLCTLVFAEEGISRVPNSNVSPKEESARVSADRTASQKKAEPADSGVLTLPDKYAAVKITVSKSDIKIKDLLFILSKETGLTLIPDRDFRVEDRRIRVFATNALISSVMYSIADVTKFKWVAKDDTYILSYNKDIESWADFLKIKSNEELLSYNEPQRRAVLEDMLADVDDLEALEFMDPVKYDMIKNGTIDKVKKLFDKMPGLEDAIAKRRPLDIRVSSLDKDTVEMLCDTFARNKEDGTKETFPTSEKEYILSVSYNVPIIKFSHSSGNHLISENYENTFQDRLVSDYIQLAEVSFYEYSNDPDTLKQPLAFRNSRSLQILNPGDEEEKAKKIQEKLGMPIDRTVPTDKIFYDEISKDTVSRLPVPYAFEFSEVIDLGKKPESFIETLELFSKNADIPVFCDNFTRVKGGTGVNSDFIEGKSVEILSKGTIYDVLSSICKTYNLNATYVNGHLDFNDIWWFNYIHSREYIDINAVIDIEITPLDVLINFGKYNYEDIKEDADAYILDDFFQKRLNLILDNMALFNALYKMDYKSREKFMKGEQAEVYFNGTKKLISQTSGSDFYAFQIYTPENVFEGTINIQFPTKEIP